MISGIFHFKKHDIAARSHMQGQKYERIKPCLISRAEWMSSDPSPSAPRAVSADFPLGVRALAAPPHPVFGQ